MPTQIKTGELEFEEVDYEPCPFCGFDSPLILVTENACGVGQFMNGRQVVCITCGARGPISYKYNDKSLRNMCDERVALHYWNTKRIYNHNQNFK